MVENEIGANMIDLILFPVFSLYFLFCLVYRWGRFFAASINIEDYLISWA